MSTLPVNYNKILKSYRIDATPFSRLRGAADSEFNNRSHRKITIIDGVIGYTGGINIADEYINRKDLDDTLFKSIEIKKEHLKTNLITKFIRAIVRIFAPML